MLTNFLIAIVFILILIAPAIKHKSKKRRFISTNAILATDLDGRVFLWSNEPIWNEEVQEFASPKDSDLMEGYFPSSVIKFIGKYHENPNKYPKPKEIKKVTINIEIL